MGKLVFKLLALSGILVILSVLLNSFLPTFWARSDLDAKSSYLNEHRDEYNTVFIGSSCIIHHVDPVLFDSLAGVDGNKIHSFNLGIPAFQFPESYRMVESTVLDKPGIKYVYIELTPVALEIPDLIENTPQNYYWYTREHADLLCRQIQQSEFVEDKGKTVLIRKHLLGFIEKSLFIGGAEVLLKSEAGNSESWILSQCKERQGFISLDTEAKQNPNAEVFRDRRIAFESDTSILAERFRLASAYRIDVAGAPSTPYSRFVGNFCREMESKGIEVYFVVAPRLRDYQSIREVISEIPADRIIELYSPEKYPQFYQFRYSFDRGHLNALGASIFTRELYNLSLKKR